MKLPFIEAGGEMNGTNEGVMNSLLTMLPKGNSISAAEMPRYEVAQRYMAELWLRGVTKEQFIAWIKDK